MAIFQGEDLVDITTPDGRTLRLPSSIVPASLMPQAPTGAPAPINTPAVPVDAAPTPAPEPAPPPVVEMGEPTVTPVYDMQPEVVTANPQRVQKARAAQAAYEASPKGQMATAQRGMNAAAQSQVNAIGAQAIAEGAQQKAVGEIQAARNTHIDQLMVQQAQAAQEAAFAEEKKAAEVGRLRDKIANTKIDRSADHPILAAISIALAGIGSAMKGESTNPALDMFFKTLDRKVTNQMGDLDLLEKTYGFKREEVADLKERSHRKLEMYNTMMAAEAQKAQRSIEAMISQTQNPIIKARAQTAAAEVQKFAAEKNAEAIRQGLDYDQKERHQKNQLGVQYAQLREQQLDRAQRADLTREGYMIDLLKQKDAKASSMTEAELKLKAKLADDVMSKGMKDLKTGTMLYTRAGLAKHKQAAVLEERAKKADPWDPDSQAEAQQLRQEAQQLRQEADLYHVALARDPEGAKKAMGQYAATKSMQGTIERINMLAKDNPRVWFLKGPQQAELDALYGELALEMKEATNAGAWDKGLSNLTDRMIGTSPTSEWDTNTVVSALRRKFEQDPQNAMVAVNGVLTRLKHKATDSVNGASQNYDRGDNPDELFQDMPKPASESLEVKASAAFQKSTPEERAAEIEDRGVVSQLAHTAGRLIANGVQGKRAGTNDQVAHDARNAGSSIKYPGLGVEQEKWFDALAEKSLSSDPGAKLAGETLINETLKAADKRPQLANAMAQAIQDAAPHLYGQLRPRVPAGSELESYLHAKEQAAAGAAMDDLGRLAQTAVVDDTSYNTLSTKAATPGPEQKAAQDLLMKQVIPARRARVQAGQ